MTINKELELPDTVFVRDIENKVFQGIVVQCLSTIEDISLIEGNFIDSLFSRASVEGVKGIHTDQDNKSHSISVKIEVNISYGISIPDKAEEIQSKVAEQLTLLTGLHVACVHVVFKNIIPKSQIKKFNTPQIAADSPPQIEENGIEKEYSDEYLPK